METLTYLAWFLPAVCGLTFLFVQARLTNGLRDWLDEPGRRVRNFFGEMLSCYACTGYWTGGALYVLTHWRVFTRPFGPDWADAAIWAGVAAFAAAAAARSWDALVRLVTRYAERPNGA